MPERSGLRAGFGRADITPQEPAPNYKGKILQLPPAGEPRLECIAAVVSVGTEMVGLVALDSLCIRRELVLRIREQLRATKGGRDLTRLIIAATHSHCTPPLAPTFLRGTVPDPMYEDLVAEKISAALEEARGGLCDARLRAGAASSPGFEFNRRLRRKDGRVVMTLADDMDDGLSPCGGVDDEVPFWFFEGPSGQPLGVIFSYASHNNAARADFFSPDIAGYCRRALQESLGRGFVGLMLAGACGDVTWLDPNERHEGGVECSEEIGRKLANSVVAAASAVQAAPVHKLEYRAEVMSIPDRTPVQSTYCEDGCRGTSPEDMQAQQRRYEPEKKAVAERGATRATVEIGALILEHTALVTNPAELFTSLGMEIRSRSRFPVTLIAGLTNGYVGYVPAAEDFALGGYETHRTVYTSRLANWAGGEIVERSVQILNQSRVPADAAQSH